MAASPFVRIDIDARETRLEVVQPGAPAPATFRLDLGVDRLAGVTTLHEPPQPRELEQAIEEIENRVMPLARSLAQVERAVVPAALWRRLRLGAGADPATGTPWRLDEVECVFNRLVDVAQGRPVAGSGLSVQRPFVIALLILREAMHHLGLASVEPDGR